jgi:hypothetical protein
MRLPIAYDHRMRNIRSAGAPVMSARALSRSSRCFVCIGKTGLWRRSIVATPVEGLLGSRADEGRAKLRYYSGKAHGAIEPEITEWDFLSLLDIRISEGQPAELKHLSRQRKRNQTRFR